MWAFHGCFGACGQLITPFIPDRERGGSLWVWRLNQPEGISDCETYHECVQQSIPARTSPTWSGTRKRQWSAPAILHTAFRGAGSERNVRARAEADRDRIRHLLGATVDRRDRFGFRFIPSTSCGREQSQTAQSYDKMSKSVCGSIYSPPILLTPKCRCGPVLISPSYRGPTCAIVSP